MTLHTHLLDTFSPVVETGAEPSIRKPQSPKKLSAIVPCYNEEDVIAELVSRLTNIGQDYELILVNDGSNDGTWVEIVRLAKDRPQIVEIDLARNHGHQLALTTGIFVARVDRILVIDADPQDPPGSVAGQDEVFERPSSGLFAGHLAIAECCDQAIAVTGFGPFRVIEASLGSLALRLILMPLRIVIILVLGSILASAGTILLKIGAAGRMSLLSFLNAPIILGLALYGLGAVSWIYALSREKLISVYPFTVLTFTIVYATGIVGLGERPARSAIVGVALILVGLYFVARNTL